MGRDRRRRNLHAPSQRGALDWNVAHRARYRKVVAPDPQVEEAA